MTKGSEVFIPKLEAYSLSELVDAFENVLKTSFKDRTNQAKNKTLV